MDLGDDIEGFVPASHTAVDDPDRLEEHYRSGETVPLRIMESDAINRRIVLEVLELPERRIPSEVEAEAEADADADAHAEAPEAEVDAETSADDVAAALDAADEPFEAICLTHSETSTGVLNPIAELAAVVRARSPDTLILVDAVTSVGGAALEFDAWGLDLAFAGTQKCLALPPGLVTYALSERAIERAAHVAGRGFLLDFAATPARFAKGESPATPCVPLVFALNRQLERIRDEGIENRWARHIAMRDLTLAFGAAHSLFKSSSPFHGWRVDRLK
jgi:hypothetical protein